MRRTLHAFTAPWRALRALTHDWRTSRHAWDATQHRGAAGHHTLSARALDDLARDVWPTTRTGDRPR